MLVFFSVLYDPGPNALRNIRLAKSLGIVPVVYLNKVDNKLMDELRSLDVVQLGRNVNEGLGIAFYEVEQYLQDNSIEHYIYFDQDTVVEKPAWLMILNTYSALFETNDVGVLFYGGNKKRSTDVVVSSGCLFSMRIIDGIGRHDKTYFVEGVDYEFCLRLRKNNYRVLNVFTEYIDHEALQDGNERKLLGSRFYVRVYGNSRLKDFNSSHVKLIFSSLRFGQVRMTFYFIKSMLAFNAKEYISRFLVTVS